MQLGGDNEVVRGVSSIVNLDFAFGLISMCDVTNQCSWVVIVK